MSYKGSYHVFVRNWWKLNPTWPEGREPDPSALKRTICYADTEEDARAACKEYMRDHPRLPGKLSRKAEYEEI